MILVFFFMISSVLIASRTKKCPFLGTLYPSKLIFFPLWLIVDLNSSFHSSQNIVSHRNDLKWTPSFVAFLLSSHSVRHFKWIYFIVPEHLQGDMSGSAASVLSSERQILHTQSLLPSSVIDSSLFIGAFLPWLSFCSIQN